MGHAFGLAAMKKRTALALTNMTAIWLATACQAAAKAAASGHSAISIKGRVLHGTPCDCKASAQIWASCTGRVTITRARDVAGVG
jgi:type 1 fimbria pilin